MKWLIIPVALSAVIGFSVINKNKSHKKNTDQAVKGSYRSFALLELFTSEGCSSCPPADKLLPEFAAIDPNIITLSFHVDYWDHLGWKDPFSNAEFSDRQRQYGQQFNLESIYTPQLIVNGQYELVGSNRSTAEADIQQVLKEKATVQLSVDEVKKSNDKLLVTCSVEGDWKNANLFIALVQKHAEMNVKAGENGGSKLSHTNVVRSFIKEAPQQKINFEIAFPKDLAENNWQLILFSQQKNELKITGAASYQPITSNQQPVI
jgi:hypothetical protein